MALVLFDELELLDVAGPVQVLTMAGRSWNFRPFKILPASTEGKLIETRSQLRLEPRHALEDLPAPEIVLVPGGYGARRALADERLVEWLRRASSVATHLVGIGNGVLLLGRAGALDDADVSVPAEMRDSLLELAPSARPDTSAEFRESGKAITARTASGGIAAMLCLVERFLGGKQAASVADAIGVPWSSRTNTRVTIME